MKKTQINKKLAKLSRIIEHALKNGLNCQKEMKEHEYWFRYLKMCK